jgi:hypothetical protein
MSKFEDSLWRDLVHKHGSDLEGMAAGPEHGGQPRRRLLAGGTLGIAGAGTAAALILGAANSAPAFAVNRNSDGTVTVYIRRVEGITGANEKLQRLGVRVQAVPVAAGCSNIPPALALARAAATGKVQVIRPGAIERVWRKADVIVSAKINPGKIPAGRTIVLPAEATIHGRPARVITVDGRAAVPACLPALPPVAIARLVCPGRVKVISLAGAGGAGPVTTKGAFTHPTITTGTTTTGTGTSTTGTSTTGTGTTGTSTTSTGPGYEILPPGASTAPFRTSTGPTTTTGTSTSDTNTGTTTTGTGTTTTGTGAGTGQATPSAAGPGARFNWTLAAPPGCGDVLASPARTPAQVRKVLKALAAARAARLKALEKAAKAQKR